MTAARPRGGLIFSLRTLLAGSVGMARTRLELLSVEVQEEKERLVSLLLYGALAFVLLSFGLFFLVAFFTVLLWDSHRLLALGAFAAVFMTAGGGALIAMRFVMRTPSRLFSASLAELAQDEAALRPETRPVAHPETRAE